ncbi:Usher syndrome type-1G protein homolog [Ischnura elegans]|uniref:Usher syndrome type-1G protein homolog n=1 Tax=Ischnura elegans TaxID=197161 RepID=UPI001ED88AD5|nr:Usher syndrome type-1G protein homolog [Ischnura elegans]
MPVLRFHEAARDGVLKILLEASEKDCNAGDSDGMTPVHWAAFRGHLSALRLLIAMGGKLSKCDSSGNTALHHAAAGGHLKVVAFIVALGGNPWDLNADFHTPKTVAGRLGKEDVLRYLDGIMGREMAFNRRKTVRREERAKKRALERFPSASGRASPASDRASVRSATTTGADSTATTPAGSRRSSVSTLFMGSSLSLFRRRESVSSAPDSVAGGGKSLSRGDSQEEDGGAQDSDGAGPGGQEVARGKQLWAMLRNAKSPVYRRMIKKRQEEARAKGLRRGDSAEPRLEECSVFYGSNANFAEIQPRSVSQPDMLSMSDVGRSISSLDACDQCLGSDGEDDVFNGHSMFERPGFGKVAFRQSSVILPASAKTLFSKLQRDMKKRSHCIGGIGDGDEEDEELSGMDVFLLAWGLVKEGPVLHRAGFTLESLMTATEEDLRQAGLPMGPRKKVLSAVQKRRAVIESPSNSAIASRL